MKSRSKLIGSVAQTFNLGFLPNPLLRWLLFSKAVAMLIGATKKLANSLGKASMSDFSSQIFGQYEILEVIGKGGMAKVYRARQLNIERYVAVKIMSSAFSDQKEFRDRFKQEADVFAKLEHPYILPIYDYGEQDEHLFLVVRLMEGGTLENFVRGKELPLDDLDRLVNQIAQALDFAHENNIIHRDLKPNNVLLDKFGNASLMDFGIAKIVSGAQATNVSTMLGTPAYMSPEQWRMEGIDGRADIYSLGVMIYEMLTGRMPFSGKTPYHLMYAHLNEEPQLPSTLFPGLSDEIDAVVLRALAKDPDARYQTAGDLSEDLSSAIRTESQDARGNLISLEDRLQDEGATIHIAGGTSSHILNSILFALDRPNKRVYAVPKIDDFMDVVSHEIDETGEPQEEGQLSDTMARRFIAWDMDDILQEIATPSNSSSQLEKSKLDKLGTMLRLGDTRQSYLGVKVHKVNLPKELAEKTNQERGLLIFEVEPGTVAERVGLVLGDTLISVNDEPFQSQDDLINLLSGDKAGQKAIIRFIRVGKIYRVKAKLD